ncbi:MAG TPA: GNAT family N-acetyltransferase [Rhizomicrobium sp.]|nr:GNAT family N-acetyltransferase [Rhizomicrobium sp.]
MNVSSFTARLRSSAEDIGRHAWNACANPAAVPNPHPFTRYEFFDALERSGSACAKSGWRPCHLTLDRGANAQALLPLYLKGHSQGEYVFDHGWAEAFERAGGRYYPKLQASVPFTPVTGPRLLVGAKVEANAARRALLNIALQTTQTLGASSLHITFMTEEEWALAAACGYLQRTDQQFHWINKGYNSFEGFLSELSSSRRKTVRKERAAVRADGIVFDWLSGDAITESHWDTFFEFYTCTGSQKWGRSYLTREFFSRVGASMGDSVLLILARQGHRPIAAALNFTGERILFGRNWGAVEYVPFLHFETCYYQAIDYAIANGLDRVEAGAQGAHKLLRGYSPTLTRSAHFIANPAFREAVANYLLRERDAVAQESEDLKTYLPFRQEG